MRTRKEIEMDYDPKFSSVIERRILEVLLDIRDIQYHAHGFPYKTSDHTDNDILNIRQRK